MSILDQPIRVGPTVTDGANQIKRRLEGLVESVRVGLSDIRRIVSEHGRSNLETEVGVGDATEMLALYNALKAVLESAEVGDTVDALPS